jgi:hypothetical protein
VLHLHFAVEFTSFPAPWMDWPPGRKAITSSPPHSRHCRMAIVMLLPQLASFIWSQLNSVQAWEREQTQKHKLTRACGLCR